MGTRRTACTVCGNAPCYAFLSIQLSLLKDGTTAAHGFAALAELDENGDLNLAADRFHSRFSDSIELTDAQRREVNLGGGGRVRSLREAAAQSSALADILQQYKNAATKEEQLALRDKLRKTWADTGTQRHRKNLDIQNARRKFLSREPQKTTTFTHQSTKTTREKTWTGNPSTNSAYGC